MSNDHYINIKKSMEKELIDPILGPDYYNFACDVYTCDDIICKDIKHEYDSKCNQVKKYKTLWLATIIYLVIYIIINVAFIY